MNKWFTKLFENIDEVSQTGVRINIVLLMAVFLTLPPSIYLAAQDGSRQIYGVVGTVIFLLVLSLVSLFLATRNQGRASMGITILGLALIAPILTSLISGLGWAIALTVAVIYIAISVQTTMRERTVRALVIGAISVAATLLIDYFATWERASYPLLQTVVPLATLAIIAAFGWFSLQLFQNFSLRTKMIVSFLVISLITTSAIGIITNLVATAQLNSVLAANFSGIANRMAREVGDTIVNSQVALEGLALNKFVQDTVEEANSENTSSLSRLSALDEQWITASDQSPLIQGVLNNELAIELSELQERLPQYAELFITDQYGAVIASTGRTSDYYQADEEWWQSAWNDGKGDLYISQPVYDESTEIYAIEIALPIPAHNQPNFVGVLRATVNINELTGILTVGELGQTGHADLLLPDNRILTSEVETIQTLEDATVSDIASIQNNFGEITVDGEQNLASKATVITTNTRSSAVIDKLGWTIVVYEGLEDAYAPVSVTTRSIFLLAVALLIAAFFVAQTLGAQLAQPIENLSLTAARIGKGELSVRAEKTSDDEVGALASSFNTMADELKNTLDGLEQRVAERTRDLEIAQSAMTRRANELQSVAEIATRASTSTNAIEMLQTVSEMTKNAYGLYHAHIYLLDDAKTKLELKAGAGEAGRIMVNEKRTIPANHPNSLVARAGRTGLGAIANDVTKEPDFLPNPLLPNTQAEMAIPIVTGNEVLGVLDVQADQVDRFSNEDIAIITTLAQQVAASLLNLQSFTTAQKQAEREAMINAISQKIQSAGTIEAALQTTARELGHALGMKPTMVSLDPTLAGKGKGNS